MRKKIAIYYFSFTGNTKAVAEYMAEILARYHDVLLFPICSAKKRSYWSWLFLSFIPGSHVKIDENFLTDSLRFDHTIIGFPKWTFSCPPVNAFIKMMKGRIAGDISIFITAGGFGEEGYLRRYLSRFSASGFRVRNTLLIRRSEIGKREFFDKLIPFLSEVMENTLTLFRGRSPASSGL